MKTKNDLKTGILIGIGMIVIPLIIMSSKPSSTFSGSHEFHVWEMYGEGDTFFMYNKENGKIRKVSGIPLNEKGSNKITKYGMVYKEMYDLY
jgi:hypothetical protein